MSTRPGVNGFDSSKQPLVLIWELTQACGLACTHCRANADPNRHPDELSTDEGKALLDDARAFGEGQLIVLSGGDPLLRSDVTELVEYGTELGHRVTMTPSGTRSLTGDRIAALSDAGLKRIALSLDGARPDTHDSFRGVPGSFEETIRAIEDAKANGLPVQINTTVCGETLGELPAIRNLLRDLGVVMWSVFFLVPVGRGQLLEPIDPEEADAVMTWLADVRTNEPFGLKTTEAPQYRRVVHQQRAHAEDQTPPRLDGDGVNRRKGIVAGDGFAFVSHTGEVYPSGFLPKSAGNVRDRSVVDIYRNTELFTSLRDRDALSGKCGACEYNHLCGGSRSRAFATTGDPLESDPLCPHVPAGYDGPLPWDHSQHAGTGFSDPSQAD